MDKDWILLARSLPASMSKRTLQIGGGEVGSDSLAAASNCSASLLRPVWELSRLMTISSSSFLWREGVCDYFFI